MKLNTYTICLLLIVSSFNQGAFAQASTLKIADSLFAKQSWKAAKEKYISYLKDTSVNALAWNRLGYSNQNLKLYDAALVNYRKALANKPSQGVINVVLVRMAKTYSLLNKTDSSAVWVLKAAAIGYNALADVDTSDGYKNLRADVKFKQVRQQIYDVIYPCAAEPRSHDFDFWIGDWNVFSTNNKTQVGTSHIEVMAGSCALLENWTSSQAHNGKSFNYYDKQAGKWEQDWIGSGGVSDKQRYLNGEYKDGAMRFTYQSTNPNGQKQIGKFIFYNIDKDTVRQYQDLSTDDGKTYTVVYDFTYVRKKA
ncbi:MAG: tetratricopeptide repeat protein [Mucilaginibacter sp.]|nr:tetratricopeptide repeat protein [Mucilaginibacter sp.]